MEKLYLILYLIDPHTCTNKNTQQHTETPQCDIKEAPPNTTTFSIVSSALLTDSIGRAYNRATIIPTRMKPFYKPGESIYI